MLPSMPTAPAGPPNHSVDYDRLLQRLDVAGSDHVQPAAPPRRRHPVPIAAVGTSRARTSRSDDLGKVLAKGRYRWSLGPAQGGHADAKLGQHLSDHRYPSRIDHHRLPPLGVWNSTSSRATRSTG